MKEDGNMSVDSEGFTEYSGTISHIKFVRHLTKTTGALVTYPGRTSMPSVTVADKVFKTILLST